MPLFRPRQRSRPTRRAPARSLSGWVLCLALLGSVSGGCAPTIAPYSSTAYEQATSLKVESLALMDRATEPYPGHAQDVTALWLALQKAHEYARGRPRNEISARQWSILLDAERNLLGGFLARWREQSTLSPVFVTEAKGLVSEAFDLIIGLESGKIRPSDVPGSE
jgi:hypothetical protein